MKYQTFIAREEEEKKRISFSMTRKKPLRNSKIWELQTTRKL
jgi:hypothetical protein